MAGIGNTANQTTEANGASAIAKGTSATGTPVHRRERGGVARLHSTLL